MGNRIQDRTFRSPAELVKAIRDEYVLTQDELAGRTRLSKYQLCRWEKGSREPTLAMLRRVLDEFGLAVTFGVEPTTAALDERLASGAEAIGLNSWLLANRVVCPALMAGVPLVVGGEFAAALQGVPIENPHIVVHLRLRILIRFIRWFVPPAARLVYRDHHSLVRSRKSSHPVLSLRYLPWWARFRSWWWTSFRLQS
jgi:transcriptional regulator with XRE-family HTH domain